MGLWSRFRHAVPHAGFTSAFNRVSRPAARSKSFQFHHKKDLPSHIQKNLPDEAQSGLSRYMIVHYRDVEKALETRGMSVFYVIGGATVAAGSVAWYNWDQIKTFWISEGADVASRTMTDNAVKAEAEALVKALAWNLLHDEVFLLSVVDMLNQAISDPEFAAKAGQFAKNLVIALLRDPVAHESFVRFFMGVLSDDSVVLAAQGLLHKSLEDPVTKVI